MKNNYDKVFKLYGKTHTIEKKKGITVDLKELADNETVCSCGDGKHHWLLTEIGASVEDKIQLILDNIYSDVYEIHSVNNGVTKLRDQVGQAKVAIKEEKNRIFTELTNNIRNIATTTGFISRNKVLEVIKNEMVR